MTNANRKRAARAYMKAHGVNYTTALRAVISGDAAPVEQHVPYGHPDWEPPGTTTELFRELHDVMNSLRASEKWQLRAHSDYAAHKDYLVGDQSHKIDPMIAIVRNNVHADMDLYDVPDEILDYDTLRSAARTMLTDGFDHYWNEATSDDGYPAAATIDIAAGMLLALAIPFGDPQSPWLQPTRNRDDAREIAIAAITAAALTALTNEYVGSEFALVLPRAKQTLEPVECAAYLFGRAGYDSASLADALGSTEEDVALYLRQHTDMEAAGFYGAISPTPDFNALYPTPEAFTTAYKNRDDTHEVTVRQAAALYYTALHLADATYQEIANLRSGNRPPKGGYLTQWPKRTHRFTNTWRKNAARTFNDHADDLASGRFPTVTCAADAISLSILIQETDFRMSTGFADTITTIRDLPETIIRNPNGTTTSFDTPVTPPSVTFDSIAEELYEDGDEFDPEDISVETDYDDPDAWFEPLFDDIEPRDPDRGHRRND